MEVDLLDLDAGGGEVVGLGALDEGVVRVGADEEVVAASLVEVEGERALGDGAGGEGRQRGAGELGVPGLADGDGGGGRGLVAVVADADSEVKWGAAADDGAGVEREQARGQREVGALDDAQRADGAVVAGVVGDALLGIDVDEEAVAGGGAPGDLKDGGVLGAGIEGVDGGDAEQLAVDVGVAEVEGDGGGDGGGVAEVADHGDDAEGAVGLGLERVDAHEVGAHLEIGGRGRADAQADGGLVVFDGGADGEAAGLRWGVAPLDVDGRPRGEGVDGLLRLGGGGGEGDGGGRRGLEAAVVDASGEAYGGSGRRSDVGGGEIDAELWTGGDQDADGRGDADGVVPRGRRADGSETLRGEGVDRGEGVPDQGGVELGGRLEVLGREPRDASRDAVGHGDRRASADRPEGAEDQGGGGQVGVAMIGAPAALGKLVQHQEGHR